jgi:hypothetical protein
MSEQAPDTTVQPYPETLQLFDREDDAAVIAKLEGQVVEEYVYSFSQPNGTVYGIGINGAEACKRELAMTGEIIEEDDVKIESETLEEARFQAKCSRWAVRKTDGLRIRLDSAIGLKRQPKFTTRRNGSQEANPHWYEQGGSKATRNAILHLTPKTIQRRIIATYKGTKHEKKLTMTPEIGDALTHEANAAFKEKDALAAAVRALKDRWIELELGKAAVQQILKKKGLPESLASRDADWTGVDIAVVHDLLKEAS